MVNIHGFPSTYSNADMFLLESNSGRKRAREDDEDEDEKERPTKVATRRSSDTSSNGMHCFLISCRTVTDSYFQTARTYDRETLSSRSQSASTVQATSTLPSVSSVPATMMTTRTSRSVQLKLLVGITARRLPTVVSTSPC